MKSETKKFFKKKCFAIGIPTIVKFRKKMKPEDFATFRATKGTLIVKWSDVLKAFRIEKDEVTKLIKEENEYTMGNILDEDIEEWLK